MATQKEAQGVEIAHLEVGEPGANIAPNVRLAVEKSLKHDRHGYTPAKGNASLRAKLAAYYSRHHNVTVNPENILVTNGSSAAFMLAFLSAFPKGAAIAVTRPGYPAYRNILLGLGFEPVEIAISGNNGWRLTAEQVRQAHAQTPFDGLLLASPANPTGAMLDADEIAAIIEECRSLNIQFISDEIYHGLGYRTKEVSALQFGYDSIIINSFSKYYCMTGWRIGWMVLPDRLVRQTEIMAQNMFISTSGPAQVAAEAALECRDYHDAQREKYLHNSMVLISALQAMGLKHMRQPDGAFYAYVDISDFSENSVDFCRDLLEQACVAATPGVDFDRQDGHKYVRFSYAGASRDVQLAMERMSGFLRQPR